MSGFGFGTRSGLHRLGTASGEPRITISAFAISEDAQPGSTVGALSVSGGSGSYTFSVPAGGDPDTKFTLAGANLNTLDTFDFETATFHEVTLEADNGSDPVLSRTLLISVTNLFEQPDLGPLSLVGATPPDSIVQIVGATQGSTISALILPTGWQLDGPNREITIASGAPTGLQSWSLIETLSDSSNSPNVSSGSTTVAAVQTLDALSLSNTTVAESLGQGGGVGTLENTTPGSQLTLTDDASGRFAISAGTLVRGATALDFESSASHQVTVRETLAGATNSPRDTVLTVTVSNVFEQPNLGTLSLPSVVSPSAIVSITGTTPGSTITAGSLPSGWTLDGPNRQILIASNAALGQQNWFLTETLSDSGNSPNTSNGSSSVEIASVAAFDPAAEGFVLFDSRSVSPNGPASTWEANAGRNTLANATSSEQPTKGSQGVSFDGTNDILTDAIRGFGAPTVSYNLDAVWNASPLGDADQFTNTGITRAPDGTWWLVNHPAGAPSRDDGILVNLSADFSSVLAKIELGSVYGVGTIGGPQGLVYDTDDDTLWFTSARMDQVKHIRTDGTPLTGDDIAFVNPAGLAIDQAEGDLIILESEGSAANKSAGVMRTVNKANGATVASGTLTDLPNWDQMFFDNHSRALFITSGYEYTGSDADTFVGIYSVDGASYLTQIAAVREPTATAIEGAFYDNGTLWINNDSGFHGGIGSGLNEVLEYDVGRIAGTRILFCGALQVLGNSSTDALIGLGHPISSGQYGHAILVGGSSDIRLFNRSTASETTSTSFNTNTPDLSATKRIVTGWFNPSDASDSRIWIDGTEVAGTVTGGANDAFSGPVVDRVSLAIGGVLNGASEERHAQVDIDAIMYGVSNSYERDHREEIEGWLAHEFGLTGNLPASHPNKTNAPTQPAPFLSAPSVRDVTNDTATLKVMTDRAEGTVYAVVTSSATQPTASQIRSGLDETGSAAAFAALQPVLQVGLQSFAATGLSIATGYFAHFLHDDAQTPSGVSNTVSSPAFITTGGVVTTRITVDFAVAGTHANFPFYLDESLLSAHLSSADNGGGDLWFSTDQAGLNRIACDVSLFDTNAGTASVFVLLPSLSAGTELYAHSGDPAVTSQPAADAAFGSQAVWADYEAVFIGDDVSAATAGGDDLVAVGANVAIGSTVTRLGQGSFDTPTNQGYKSTGVGPFVHGDEITLSAWVRQSDVENSTRFNTVMFELSGSNSGDGMAAGINANSPFMFTTGGNTDSAPGTYNFAIGTWALVHWVWDQPNTDLRCYVDGNLDLADTNYTDTSGADTLRIGINAAETASLGCFVEMVKAYKGLRSADWIEAEHANQNNPATFASAGLAT